MSDKNLSNEKVGVWKGELGVGVEGTRRVAGSRRLRGRLWPGPLEPWVTRYLLNGWMSTLLILDIKVRLLAVECIDLIDDLLDPKGKEILFVGFSTNWKGLSNFSPPYNH